MDQNVRSSSRGLLRSHFACR